MKVSGIKIKEFREGRGWTTSKLAAEVQPPVTRQAIESWERNGVGGFKTITKIAAALDIAPELLVER